MRSKTLKPGGMIAQDGRPAAKMAKVGWKDDGSSSEPAYKVYEFGLADLAAKHQAHADGAAIADRVAAVRRFRKELAESFA